MEHRKQLIIDALHHWIAQRPGLEFGNYGNVTAYRAECRSIAKDLRTARLFLRDVANRDFITADDLIEAARGAYSGRLSIVEGYWVNGKGPFHSSLYAAQQTANSFLPAVVSIESAIEIDYCPGQYWPTEYRRAVCAVLASALWARKRADLNSDTDNRPVRSLGDEICQSFAREYGRGIARAWFQ